MELSVILLVGVTVRVLVRVGVIDRLGLGDFGGVKFGVSVIEEEGVGVIVCVCVTEVVLVEVLEGVLVLVCVGDGDFEGVGPGLAGSISIRTTMPLPIIEKSVVHVINISSCVA